MALEYHRLCNDPDRSVVDHWRSMVSGFGATDTKLAIDQMRDVYNLMSHERLPTINWYAGLVVKALYHSNNIINGS